MDKVFKLIELVGTSEDSYEAAIRLALKKAAESLKDIMWFEVEEQRGGIGPKGAVEFQVKLRVAFKLK